MRRVAAFLVAVILGGVIIASASTLDVDGGVLQAFRFKADVTVPVTPTGSVPVPDDVAALPSGPGTTAPLPTATTP